MSALAKLTDEELQQAMDAIDAAIVGWVVKTVILGAVLFVLIVAIEAVRIWYEEKHKWDLWKKEDEDE